MSGESVDVKVARIEENVKSLHAKFDAALAMKEKLDRASDEVLILKRDRWWFALSTIFVTSLIHPKLGEMLTKFAEG